MTKQGIKGVTIYCGSSTGARAEFTEAAAAVGRAIAAAGVPMISGGGNMGMMGAAAEACRAAGGRNIAVIPQFMVDRGWNDTDAVETVVTPDMHIRKQIMARMAKGVIALPGGIGTLEELCEIITWRQLGLFRGNVVILNTAGYYDPLLSVLSNAVAEGFMPADHSRLWQVTTSPEQAVEWALAATADMELKPKF